MEKLSYMEVKFHFWMKTLITNFCGNSYIPLSCLASGQIPAMVNRNTIFFSFRSSLVDHTSLCYPLEGVMIRFSIFGTLAPSCIGPFIITERFGLIACEYHSYLELGVLVLCFTCSHPMCTFEIVLDY